MNRSGFVLFLGVTLGASALLSVGAGCSSSSTGTGGGTTSSSTSSTSSSSTTSSSSSTTSSSGTVATLDCTSYCTEVMANCTGAQQQFTGMDTCMGTCAGYFAMGTLADTSGDTLGCRIYHGGAPAKADPVTHCPHAGPTGGDKDPNGTTGTCGEDCESFCSIAHVVCAGQPSEYTDLAACMTECKTFKVDANAYSTADTTTNDMGCRMYHLTAASPGGT